jgi:hypothetical protein
MEAAGNPRQDWAVAKDLLHCRDRQPNEGFINNEGFCQTLATYFLNKVNIIKQSISSSLIDSNINPSQFDTSFNGYELTDFMAVSALEIKRLLSSMQCKSSTLYLVPTSLWKACSTTFSVIIANLANVSFQTGIFQAAFKRAQVTPLIKRHGLIESDPSNYRPISNLNTISKIIERLALSRLTSHIKLSSANDCLQSAYKRGHSTETALLKLTDDVFNAMDTKESTILVAVRSF